MPVLSGWSYWKQHVRIPRLLEATGHLACMRLSGSRLRGPCPVHHGDNPHAFQVDLERNIWYCFTRCARGGDVVELARALSGGSWPRTAQWLGALSRFEPATRPRPLEISTEASTAPSEFAPFTRKLTLDPAHPFLLARGLTAATARRFEAGAWYGPGFLEATVAVRVHDPHARPLGYAARRLDAAAVARWGKWKWPPGFPKAHILWNWHRLRPDDPRGLIVVESPWSVMKLSQAGFDNAVALCGLTISPAQSRMLGRARQILLFLDGDQAGLQASARHLASNLHPVIRAIHPPPALDPADLTEAHLFQLLKPSTR